MGFEYYVLNVIFNFRSHYIHVHFVSPLLILLKLVLKRILT